jgi:hypothetical protein
VKNVASGKKLKVPSELHKRVGESRKPLSGEGLTSIELFSCKTICALLGIVVHFPQSTSEFAVTPSPVLTPNLCGFPNILASY